MSNKKSNRAYMLGWLDCMMSLTDIHTKDGEKKVFYSCDEYCSLDVREYRTYKFRFTDNGKPTTRVFDDSEINGFRANYEEGIFSIVLNDGFCLKMKMYNTETRKVNKEEFHGFTIGDWFRR